MGTTGFPGSGTGFADDPLSPNAGPDTADACPAVYTSSAAPQIVNQAKTCFYGPTTDPENPAATIEQIVEIVNGKKVVHIRITFNPTFVDNTYGDNAIGWGSTPDGGAQTGTPMPGKPMPRQPPKPPPPPKGKGGHTFDDLVGSDHVELKLFDGAGGLTFYGDVDYVSQDSASPCGYGTLGVTGGEGKVLVGNTSDVLAVATSLDRDLNGCGHCLTEDSPATDANYTANPSASDWDYRVSYELWLDGDAFGTAGFGYAVIYSIHASPSKLDSNTISVTPKSCPPSFSPPACSPSTSGEGIECGAGSGGSGGASGADGGGICPPGTVPDLASEGKFCVPV